MLSETVAGQRVFLPDFPDYDPLASCIHCGRCLPVCPTYQETLHEAQSPRGRLALLKAVADGELELTAGVEAHLHHCLDCRACNTVCPVGIPIGQSIVAGRAAARSVRPPGRVARLLLGVLSHPPLMEALFASARLYNATLRPLAARLGLTRWLPERLRSLESSLPERVSAPLRPRLPAYLPATSAGGPRRRVGFFLGCVMNVAFADASEASITLLRRHDCDVVPLAPGCCGSPHEHAGAAEAARASARETIAAFEAQGELEAIVCDSAGCTGMLKSYGHLLHGDPEWAARAEAFSARVRDVTEFLDGLLPPPETRRGEAPTGAIRVTYHAPCHLSNMQGIVREPHRLLARVQGAEVIPLPDERRCCGSAGTYNLTHPEMAQQLLDAKLDAIESTGADVVVSCNPGCQMHIAAGLRARGSTIEVRHLSELLLADAAGNGVEPVMRRSAALP